MAMLEQASATGSPLTDVDIMGIMRLLPHRYPFLLVDRVVEIEAFRRAVGIKNVTINEPFFPGHFPADPIMPGVLLIEALAQTAAVLVIASIGEAAAGSPVYFMSIDGARFRRPVRPGDRLRLEVTILRSRLGVSKFAGKALVEGEVAAEAEFAAKLMSP
jgi:3-hydroxyacyl-[acyl-carrier-protein] dehydratase